MSAIKAISGSSHNLYQLVQALGQQPAAPATSTTANSLSGSVTASPATLASALQQAQGKHHKPGGGGGALFKKIEQSVTSALQSAGPTADPNKVVQDAISQVLKSNGATQAATDPESDGDSDGTHQTFVQTLQAFGITPDQFRNDLVTAMHDAQGNAANGTTMSSFPPGLFLDTAA